MTRDESPPLSEEAFALAMKGRIFGEQETKYAREWFNIGWRSACIAQEKQEAEDKQWPDSHYNPGADQEE